MAVSTSASQSHGSAPSFGSHRGRSAAQVCEDELVRLSVPLTRVCASTSRPFQSSTSVARAPALPEQLSPSERSEEGMFCSGPANLAAGCDGFCRRRDLPTAVFAAGSPPAISAAGCMRSCSPSVVNDPFGRRRVTRSTTPSFSRSESTVRTVRSEQHASTASSFCEGHAKPSLSA